MAYFLTDSDNFYLSFVYGNPVEYFYACKMQYAIRNVDMITREMQMERSKVTRELHCNVEQRFTILVERISLYIIAWNYCVKSMNRGNLSWLIHGLFIV